jgi:ABC-type transport system substrate-binding protein
VALRAFFATNGGRNVGKYSDASLDRLIDRQRSIFDRQQRKAQVKEVLRYVQENAPYTVFSNRYVLNVAQAKIKNRAPDSALSYMIGFQYEHVWLDV